MNQIEGHFSEADLTFLREGYPSEPITDAQWQMIEAAANSGVAGGCSLCIVNAIGINRSGGMHSH